MQENEIEIFIEGISNYFTLYSEEKLTIDTPYLLDNVNKLVYDYTGIIGITGNYSGCVYFTAPKVLLKYLLLSLGEEDLNEVNIADLVGEIANTISGNARKHLGSNFMISVPVVVDGAINKVQLPKDLRSYVIPVKWRNYSAAMVISIEK